MNAALNLKTVSDATSKVQNVLSVTLASQSDKAINPVGNPTAMSSQLLTSALTALMDTIFKEAPVFASLTALSLILILKMMKTTSFAERPVLMVNTTIQLRLTFALAV